MKYLVLSSILLFLSFSVFCQEAGEPVDPIEEPTYNSPEDWCPPEPCSICDLTINSTNRTLNFTLAEGQSTICFSGSFRFTGTIKHDVEDENYFICIPDSGSEIIFPKFPQNGPSGITRLVGSWTLKNYGDVQMEGKTNLKIDQSIFNHNFFTVTNNDEFLIEEGGLFCNSGTAILTGDIINYGIIRSSGYLESGSEFKNYGITYITDMVVTDEITNFSGGVINLQGSIESKEKSFKNEGDVFGLESPCNSIKANFNIINNGYMDGSSGPIAIGVDEINFNNNGDIEQELFFTDTDNLENINEDCFRILPVIFNEFETILNDKQRTAILTWSTSKEWENSHFEIQRSLDGAASFENVAEVAGMGWTDELTEYTFEDSELPLAGGNVFYRLKQVDFNGKYKYSEITAVRVSNIHFTKGVWRAYPNPNRGDDFQLELVDVSQYQDEAVTLRVLSSTLSSNEMTFKNLHELNSSASSIMANAPNGLWIIELQWGNKVERIKVMKK